MTGGPARDRAPTRRLGPSVLAIDRSASAVHVPGVR